MHDAELMQLDLRRPGTCRAPALLTWGGRRAPFFPAVVAKIAGASPHAEQQLFADTGHVPHVTHPREYVAAVLEFTARSGSRVVR
jgi:pimeloyl-ACP methyl ester carboxylesterase